MEEACSSGPALLERERARRCLRAEWQHLVEQLQALQLAAQPEPPPVTDDEERSATETAHELEQMLLEVTRGSLESVERALARLDQAGYGRCTDCGGTIGAARLRALPAADRCLACATRREEERFPPVPCPACHALPCRCVLREALTGELAR